MSAKVEAAVDRLFDRINLMADPESVEVWSMMMRIKAIRELPYDQQEAVYDDITSRLGFCW